MFFNIQKLFRNSSGSFWQPSGDFLPVAGACGVLGNAPKGLFEGNLEGHTYPVDAVLVHSARTQADIVDLQSLEALAKETQDPARKEWANL